MSKVTRPCKLQCYAGKDPRTSTGGRHHDWGENLASTRLGPGPLTSLVRDETCRCVRRAYRVLFSILQDHLVSQRRLSPPVLAFALQRPSAAFCQHNHHEASFPPDHGDILFFLLPSIFHCKSSSIRKTRTPVSLLGPPTLSRSSSNIICPSHPPRDPGLRVATTS